MSDLRDQLEALADAAPPPTGAAREREIRRALAAGTPPAPRRVWPWLAIGAGVCAAAALALWLGLRAPHAGDAVAVIVEAGDVAAPRPGEAVEAPREVVVRLPDETRLVAAAHTRLVREDARATRWRLERGRVTARVTKRAPGETFEVVTDEAVVTVVGTQFVVGRFAIDGRVTSYVAVREGVVRVTPVHGEAVLVHAGEAWPPGSDPRILDAATVPDDAPAGAVTADAAALAITDAAPGDGEPGDGAPGDAAPSYATPPDATPDATLAGAAPADAAGRAAAVDGERARGAPPDAAPHVREPAPPAAFDAAVIRKTIRAGNLLDARRLIDSGRKVTTSQRGLAELGILAAEADLAERKTRSAIAKYLDVVRDFPTTPQAEQALFAAAQLALDRPDAGYKAEALLRDYLDTYPRGQFAKDAQRLLDARKN